MKKKLLAILLISALSTCFTACSNGGTENVKKSEQPKEYNMDDFGVLFEETNELFEKESEYLTNEELISDKGYALYEKCSKETGLPFNESITLRGKKSNSLSGFFLTSSDEKYYIGCYFSEGTQNKSFFIENGENLVVTGIISESVDSYGSLTNITIESPENIDISYENNITEILADYENISGAVTIQGEINIISPLEEFEQAMDKMGDMVSYEHEDYYYESVAGLTDGDKTIYFMYNPDTFPNLKVGDKIAITGYVDDLMHVLNYDGTLNISLGLVGNIYDIYIFE